MRVGEFLEKHCSGPWWVKTVTLYVYDLCHVIRSHRRFCHGFTIEVNAVQFASSELLAHVSGMISLRFRD